MMMAASGMLSRRVQISTWRSRLMRSRLPRRSTRKILPANNIGGDKAENWPNQYENHDAPVCSSIISPLPGCVNQRTLRACLPDSVFVLASVQLGGWMGVGHRSEERRGGKECR